MIEHKMKDEKNIKKNKSLKIDLKIVITFICVPLKYTRFNTSKIITKPALAEKLFKEFFNLRPNRYTL